MTAQIRRLAVFNQKGGVGKTSTAANLAVAMQRRGRSVVAIDADPQGHLTASLCGPPRRPGLAEAIDGAADIDALLIDREGISVLPCGIDLVGVIEQGPQSVDGHKVARLLDHFGRRGDLMIIDCPPSVNWIVRRLLERTPDVLVPVAGDYLALQGLADLTVTLRSMEQTAGVAFRHHIVVTRYDRRRRLCTAVLEKLTQHFPGRVARTLIRECVAIAEAPSFATSVIEHAPSSNGAVDYRALAEDLLLGRYRAAGETT
ncbi:MAG TPA: ParA family protein [Pseudomonadales bacterium]|nr:ParA family protein [Pseudomonadales bacterium]